MKYGEYLKKIKRNIYRIPIFGRVLRIAIAIIYLPETKNRIIQISKEITNISHVLSRLEQQKCDIGSEYFADAQVEKNFLLSVPVVLRKNMRDIIELKKQLEMHSNVPSRQDSKL